MKKLTSYRGNVYLIKDNKIVKHIYIVDRMCAALIGDDIEMYIKNIKYNKIEDLTDDEKVEYL